MQSSEYKNRIKRVIAIVMSLCGIICLSWLYLLIVVAIKIDSPGPLFLSRMELEYIKNIFKF